MVYVNEKVVNEDFVAAKQIKWTLMTVPSTK